MRPLTLSKEETCGEVGDVVGDEEGDIFVLILVVRVRKIAILGVDDRCWHVASVASVCVTVEYADKPE